jgi:hypothetical protein
VAGAGRVLPQIGYNTVSFQAISTRSQAEQILNSGLSRLLRLRHTCLWTVRSIVLREEEFLSERRKVALRKHRSASHEGLG